MDERYVVEKIEQLCKDNKWTYYRLSLESGIPHSTLHNIMHRSTVPSIPSIMRICDAFGISMAQFFNENNVIDFLSESEIHLIETYRKFNKLEKELTDAYMHGILDRKQSQQKSNHKP